MSLHPGCGNPDQVGCVLEISKIDDPNFESVIFEGFIADDKNQIYYTNILSINPNTNIFSCLESLKRYGGAFFGHDGVGFLKKYCSDKLPLNRTIFSFPEKDQLHGPIHHLPSLRCHSNNQIETGLQCIDGKILPEGSGVALFTILPVLLR